MEFTLTEDEMQSVLDASKPVPYLVIGGIPPRSQQEQANSAWQKIAEAHSVKWDTIRPINEATRLMSGEAL